MKWVLYAIAGLAVLVGVIGMTQSEGVFHETVSALMILVGTSSFGFAVITSKLDTLAHTRGEPLPGRETRDD